MQGTQIDNHPVERFSTVKKFSMLDAVFEEQDKTCSFGENEFGFREKVEANCFIWNFQIIKIVKEGRKTMTSG